MEENDFSIEYILENSLDKLAYGFIYITKYEGNGMKYIGKCKFNKITGWLKYIGSGTHFLRAVKKYGKENFCRKIIAIAYSKEELNLLEIKFIRNHNAVKSKKYYNLGKGGEGNTSIPSKETRQKMSEMRKNHNHSIKTIEKMKINSYWKGKHRTKEEKQHLREINIGKFAGENNYFYGKHFLGQLNPFYGKRHTLESKKKMSDSLKGLRTGRNNPHAKQIICITTGIKFFTNRDASEFYNCNKGSISSCCTGNRKSAGKNLITNEPLKWMYYDEYIKSNPIAI